MLPILVLNLLGLTVVLSASISPLNLPPEQVLGNSSLGPGANTPGTKSLPTTNTSLAGEPLVDNRFRVTVYGGAEKLNGKSALLSMIKILLDLSFHDFDQAYSGGTYNYPEYNDVKIVFEDTTKKLTYRFAIWGICKAVLFILESSRIYRRIFVLQWYENTQLGAHVEVGRISMIPVNKSGNISASNGTQNLEGLTSGLEGLLQRPDLDNLTSMVAPGPLGPPDSLQVFAELYGSTISLKQVFVPITLALVDIASHPATDTVTEWSYKAGKTNSRFDWFIEDPRTSPPFFEWGYAARAVELIPRFMFEKRTFSEVKILVGYADVPLGVGYVTKGDRRPVPPGEVETA